MNGVELKIKSILEGKVKVPFEYSRNLHLINDLSIDSVEMLEFIVQIEDDFDIIFEDEEMDINLIGSLECLISLIEQKIQG